MEARRGRDANGDSMRSTTARPGIAGRRTKPWNLETTSTETQKTHNPFPRLCVNPQNRRSTNPALRQPTKLDLRLGADPYKRKGASPHNTRPGTTAPANITGSRDNGRKKGRKRPAEQGAGATLSRPCCGTRSDCAFRPRPQPGGHRWSPGTTDHPRSPTGRADPPC